MDWEDLSRRAVPEPAPECWEPLTRHLAGKAERSASRLRWLRRGRWAAAAAVLLALAWIAPRKSSPIPPPAAKPHPEALYLAPDCRLLPEKGARILQEGGCLRLEAGSIEWINRGWTTVALETPLGMLKGETVEARVSLSAPTAMSWVREAQAGEPTLTVEVREGKLTFSGTEIPAGKAATISGGITWRDIPKRERPASSEAIQAVSGHPAFLPLSGTSAWELEVRSVSDTTSLGLAFPTAGGLRLWHLQDCGAGRWMRLRVAAKGEWAEGWADGLRRLSASRASRQLQAPPGREAGLYVWGKVEVRRIRTEDLP